MPQFIGTSLRKYPTNPHQTQWPCIHVDYATPALQEALKAKMQGAGFKHVSYTNYTAGVVAVHSGFKL